MNETYPPAVACRTCWRPTRAKDGLCAICADRNAPLRPASQPTEDELRRFYEFWERQAASLGVTVDDLEEQGFPVSVVRFREWRDTYGGGGDGDADGGDDGQGPRAPGPDDGPPGAEVEGGDDDRAGDVCQGVRLSGGPTGRERRVRRLHGAAGAVVGPGDSPAPGRPAGAVVGTGSRFGRAVDDGDPESDGGAGVVGLAVARQRAGVPNGTLFDPMLGHLVRQWPKKARTKFALLDRVVLLRSVGGIDAAKSGDVLAANARDGAGVMYTVAFGGSVEVSVSEMDLRGWMQAN